MKVGNQKFFLFTKYCVPKFTLIDTHTHLDMPEFDSDLPAVLDRAQASGVELMINPGSEPESNQKIIDLCKKYPGKIYGAIGVHPHDADKVNDELINDFEKLIINNKSSVVAIGEIGLDFFRNQIPEKIQVEAFRKQLELATKLDLPVIIHTREAEALTLEILKQSKVSKGVIHCYTGSAELAHRLIELGFLISFTGIITFPKTEHLAELIETLPLEKILIETDGPWLTPVPHRGVRCEPAHVRLVAEKIAEIKKIDFAEVNQVTTANAKSLFQIK